MKLVVGLGNPGDRYEKTRHNLGFLVLDRLAERHKIAIDIKKKKSLIGKMKLNNDKIIILKPQTFVNLSGEAVLYMASFLRIQPENIIVVCDDANLDLGKLSVRKYGSSGGHNGIKSLIKFLKADNFPRIRIGIGRPDPSVSLESHVLGFFSKDELNCLAPIIDESCDIIEKILAGDIDSCIANREKQMLHFEMGT
ncbi:peptidyl-tRNA hydrolase [Brevinema andersonii]|uniref:Peptidyl-tRNA hydrolase n=1 Tax=Brevinema andersonii TaxID=34097 RepID=A0A1I1DAA1_BREAD|nr:aminoacyl-tRNA hydrolase [Brevinema andersonii]SFB71282.1 peptidyl-tRNA hydrolase [Brevinema andersonii]